MSDLRAQVLEAERCAERLFRRQFTEPDPVKLDEQEAIALFRSAHKLQSVALRALQRQLKNRPGGSE